MFITMQVRNQDLSDLFGIISFYEYLFLPAFPCYTGEEPPRLAQSFKCYYFSYAQSMFD